MLRVLPYVIVILATFFVFKSFDAANKIDLQAIANTALKSDKNNKDTDDKKNSHNISDGSDASRSNQPETINLATTKSSNGVKPDTSVDTKNSQSFSNSNTTPKNQQPAPNTQSNNTATINSAASDLSPLPNSTTRANNMEECITELTNGEFNNGTIETLQNLQKRREEIDKKEEWVKVKETALNSINLDIEAKIANLQQLQTNLKSMLQEHGKRENEKIMRLVRVYETMKAKDAAKIFDELQGDILVDIAESMKEGKLAAIVADMTPEKAKNLSIALANKRQILTRDGGEK